MRAGVPGAARRDRGVPAVGSVTDSKKPWEEWPHVWAALVSAVMLIAFLHPIWRPLLDLLIFDVNCVFWERCG